MTSRFLLIKHLSLGFGVLLKRENADVGRIYFAESHTVKSVILSHPCLSVADNLTLSKFVSLGLYEGLFDEQAKEKAQEYLDNHIKDMHVSENECYGSIVGSHEYLFRITIDTNAFINIQCTCPSNNLCKHVYAVFVSMRKLISPKAGDEKMLASPSASNEFKDALERFLYVRSAENIILISKLSYQLFNAEKVKLFVETLLPFYQRGQYKARVISDILAPLYFSSKNQENFNKVKEEAVDDIKAMLDEAENYYQNLYREYERKSDGTKKVNLYHILLTPDCSALAALLRHAEDNYSEERLASQVMVEYIKYNDLTIEDIILLKDCWLFQVNHRYYMNDLLNSPMKNRLSGYLLFFDELPLDENKIKQIPLNYFLKVAPYSNDKSHYIQIVYTYFDQLKEEDIDGLVELLVGVSLQHEYIDERTIRLSIELSKKIPSGTFVAELVDNNIRRPKKAKAN